MAETRARAHSGWVYWLFIVVMLGLTVLFVVLGVWQLQRLGEKEALIASVAARLDSAPKAFPSASLGEPEIDSFNFAPVTLSGHFVPEETVLVFTSLGDEAGGRFRGPGYWVMTPFALQGGGSAFVNRGFVPQPKASAYLDDPALSSAEQTITGIARKSERIGSFTPETDKSNRIDWVRNTERLAALADPALAPVSQLYVDLPAGEPGTLPQGGETIVEFPNSHLEYAGTWFCFAAITPIMLAIWIRRQRRAKPASSAAIARSVPPADQ
jgi:surfeit locus 1 family protein